MREAKKPGQEKKLASGREWCGLLCNAGAIIQRCTDGDVVAVATIAQWCCGGAVVRVVVCICYSFHWDGITVGSIGRIDRPDSTMKFWGNTEPEPHHAAVARGLRGAVGAGWAPEGRCAGCSRNLLLPSDSPLPQGLARGG